MLGHLGAMLGPCWAILGPAWAYVGCWLLVVGPCCSWAYVGPMLALWLFSELYVVVCCLFGPMLVCWQLMLSTRPRCPFRCLSVVARRTMTPPMVLLTLVETVVDSCHETL